MWETIPREEQETVISIDYEEKTLTFYTTRKSVAKRIERKVGSPTKVDIFNDKISGVTYVRNLHDNDIKQFLSVSTIVGGFRKQNSENKEILEDE